MATPAEMHFRFTAALAVLLCLFTPVRSQNEPSSTAWEDTATTTISTTSTASLDATANSSSANAYCFRFTWLGPDYDSSVDIAGASCTDILNTYTDTPCTRPLVATNNGYLPDTDRLWERYQQDPSPIACRLTAGNVCVKYVHRYNNQYQNITYTCSKVTLMGEGPATSGCYSEKLDGYEVEVCVCRSRVGDKPCNAAHSLQQISGALCSVIVALWLLLITRR